MGRISFWRRTALLLLLLCLAAASASAQEETDGEAYRIQSVGYEIKGLTKASALGRELGVDTTTVFRSREELLDYVDSVTRGIENMRQFDTVQCELSEGEAGEDGVVPVTLTYRLKDSFHVLALPWLTYNSNSGLSAKLKLKDSNFLGLLEPLNADLNYRLDTAGQSHAGFNLDYNYPFTTGILQNTFRNSFTFDWVIGSDSPELSYSTGISTSIPVGRQRLNVSFTQSLTKENDYTKYGDQLYLTESAGISLPVSLGKLGGTIPVTYTPSASFTYYWDPTDGEIAYSGLYSPSLSIRQSVSAGRSEWKGNFRNGFSFSASSGAAWNFQTQKISASASMNVKLFKAWKYAGITSDIYLYTAYNTSTSVTERLRGTRDAQAGRYTQQALVVNFDVPVHIITTDWKGWELKLFGPYEERNAFLRVLTWLPHKLFPYLDFELQLSPFMDVALTKNTKTGRTFYWKDGFYNAGVEVLVHPLRWKSYVVRASLGFDIARIPPFTKVLDTSWRSGISRWELFVGIGFGY